MSCFVRISYFITFYSMFLSNIRVAFFLETGNTGFVRMYEEGRRLMHEQYVKEIMRNKNSRVVSLPLSILQKNITTGFSQRDFACITNYVTLYTNQRMLCNNDSRKLRKVYHHYVCVHRGLCNNVLQHKRHTRHNMEYNLISTHIAVTCLLQKHQLDSITSCSAPLVKTTSE